MTTLSLKKTNTSTTVATDTPLYPTISAYNTWYPCGSADWVATTNDIITLTQFVVYDIDNIVCTTGQDFAVYTRETLYDVTVGATVPGTEALTLHFKSLAGLNYGAAKGIANAKATYLAGVRGLLTAGHSYSWSLDIMKARITGSPTCDIFIQTSYAASSTAKIL